MIPLLVMKVMNFSFRKILEGEDRGHLLLRAEIEKIDDRLAPGDSASLRKFMNLHPVDLSGIGEEEDIVMGGSDEEVFYKILFLDIDAHLSLSAAMLAPVEADGISLDISRVGDRHHHILFGDQVFDPNLWGDLHDFRFPFVSKGVSNRDQFLLDRR